MPLYVLPSITCVGTGQVSVAPWTNNAASPVATGRVQSLDGDRAVPRHHKARAQLRGGTNGRATQGQTPQARRTVLAPYLNTCWLLLRGPSCTARYCENATPMEDGAGAARGMMAAESSEGAMMAGVTCVWTQPSGP